MTTTRSGGEAGTGTLAKAMLRTRYREHRRSLSTEEQHRHADAVASALTPRLCATFTVAVYLSHDGEIDLAPFVAQARQRGTTVAVPVLARGALGFVAYGADEPLRRVRHGLLEPANPVPAHPHLVLAPLVAFDEQGRRLGMGGGHYDRYFAAHPNVERIGVAHECQRAADLPTDPWDVPLAAVVTERGWRRFDNPRPAA